MSDLLIGVGVDLSDLRRDLKASEAFFRDFRDEVAGLLTQKPIIGDLTPTGRKAASQMLAGIQAIFNKDTTALKEQLGRGLISPEQYKILGTRAAENFNKGLSDGISRLDAQDVLPAGLRAELVDEFKDIGEKSGDLLAKSVADRFAKIGEKVQNIGIGLTKTVTAPIIAIATGAVAASETLDNAYDTIRIQTGKTGDALRALQTDFDSVFSKVPNSAQDVADAISEVSRRTGATASVVQDLSTEYLTLSRLLQTDVTPLIQQNTQTFNAFGIAVRDQARELDFLFKASQQSGVGLVDLSRDLQQFGAPLRQIGLNFEQATALIATLRKEGVNTEQALAGLGRAVVLFAKKTGDPIDAMKVFLQMLRSAKSESAALDLGSKVFGTRGAANFVTAVREGKVAFDDFLASVSTSPETIARAAADTDGFAEELKNLKNQITQAAAPLGVELVRTFKDLQPTLLGAIRVISDLGRAFAALPEGLRNTIIGAAALAAGVGPVLVGIGSLTKVLAGLPTIISGASRALAILTTAGGLAELASLLLPGGIILVGLGLLATAIYKSGEAARAVKRDIENYKDALAGIGRDSLPDLNKTVQAMEAQLNAIKEQKALLERTQPTVLEFTSTSMGVVSTRVKNPAIAALDEQLRRIGPMLTDAKARFNALLDAELATETGAHGVTAALKKVGTTATGLNLNLDLKTPEQALRELGTHVKNVVDSFELMRKRNEDSNDVIKHAVELHAKIDTLLGLQKDKVSDAAIAYRSMLAQLEKIEAVSIRAFEKKIEPAKIIDVPRARIHELIPTRETTLTIPVDIRLKPGAESDFAKALGKAEQAKLGEDFAAMSGDARRVAEAQKVAALATANLRREAAALSDTIEHSTLSDAEKRKRLDDIKKAMEGVGAASKQTKSDVEALADKLDVITTAGRGLLNIADAFGKIGDEARKAVEGVLGVGEGLEQIIRARADVQRRRDAGENVSGIQSLLAQLPGIVGVVGGIAQLATSLLGDGGAGKANREILKKNNEQLEGMRQDLRGFSNAVGQIVNASKALTDSAILKAAAAFRTRIGGRDVEFKSVEGLDKELRAAGSSIAELKRRADDLGISIVNSKGRITAEGLAQLNEALILAATKAIRFGNSVEDQRSKIDLRQAIFDIDQTPMQKLNNELSLLGTEAPALFKKFFGTVDTSTEEGRAAVEAGLRALTEAFINGSISLADFGEIVDKSQLTEILRNADSALDDLTKSANDASSALVNVPSGFAVAKRVFDSITDTLNAQKTDLQKVAGAITPTTPPPLTTPTSDIDKLVKALQAAPLPTPLLKDADLEKITSALRDVAVPAEAVRQRDIDRIVDAITSVSITADTIRQDERNTIAQAIKSTAIAAPTSPTQDDIARLQTMFQAIMAGTTPKTATPNTFNFDFGGITIPGPIGPGTNVQELLTKLREALIAKLRTISPQSVEAFVQIWPA